MCDDDDDPDSSVNNKENDQMKRKYLSMLPSLFRKKSPRYKANSNTFRKHSSFEVLNDDKLSVSFPITDSCLIPGSPISPRVKNFNSDMRSLAMSRTDNPYISQQIERSNSISSDYTSDYNNYALSTPILSIRKNRQCYFNSKKSPISGNILDLSLNVNNDSSNLHDKLIRSPPPNFPEKISQFSFVESFIGQVEDEDDKF